MTLARTTPLRRKTPLRSYSRTKKYRRRERDLEYMGAVRRLPCAVRTYILHPTPCSGRVQVDHAGEHGLGQKSDDKDTLPLCERHHRNRTDYTGPFKDWDGKRMRAWCNEVIVCIRARVNLMLGRK